MIEVKNELDGITNIKEPEAVKEIMKTKPNNKNLLGELWNYLKIRKKWWLLPIIILLVLVGALVIFGQSSALSPFIYALG